MGVEIRQILRRASFALAAVAMLMQTTLPIAVSALNNASAPVSSNGVTPYIIDGENNGGNRTCAEVGTAFYGNSSYYNSSSARVNYNESTNTFDVSFPSGITVTVSQDKYVSWSSTFPIGAVIVKGSSDANVYKYDPQSSADSGLASPTNNSGNPSNLSNLTFCWKKTKGSIKIVKDAQPNDDQNFKFNIDQKGSGGLYDNFELDDNGTETGNSTKSSELFSNLDANEYVITESSTTGWKLTDIVCTGGSDIDKDVSKRKVTVELQSGENVVCTFTNKASKLTIVKDAQPNSPDDFKFIIDKHGSGLEEYFWLDDDEDGTLSNSKSYTALEGTYYITEYDKSGWTLSDITCDKTQGVSINKDTGKITVNVEAGEQITCTYTNMKKGSVTIVKDATPNHSDNFTFKTTGLPGSNFTLDDDSGAAGANSYYSNSKTFENLVAGNTYTVTEESLEGWSLSDIVCNGSGVTTSVQDRKVTIKLAPGDAVSCTFKNTKHGKIIVNKHTNPDKDPTNFDISATGTGTIFGDADRGISDGESEKFYVLPGTYSVTETVPEGWAQTSSDCNELVVAAGQVVECDIYNQKLSKVTIIKEAQNYYGDQKFHFTSSEGNFYLSDNDSKTFDGLDIGTFSVNEEKLAGWKLNDIYCNSGNTDLIYSDGVITGVEIDLEAGEHVTCTFTNGKLNSISGHKFEDVNMNGYWDSEDESGLEGWTITLEKEVCDQYESSRVNVGLLENINQNYIIDNPCYFEDVTTDITDENGYYEFNNLDWGYYRICEVQQDGWVQTAPTKHNGCYKKWIEGYNVTVTGKDFGNYKLGMVSGFKFNDANANGAYDEGEEKLENWTINLIKNCVVEEEPVLYLSVVNDIAVEEDDCMDEIVATTQTDANGNYNFTNLEKGEYLVCEVQQDGWVRTYPSDSDCHEFEVVNSGTDVTANFGNTAEEPGQVLGTSTPTLVKTGSSTLLAVIAALTLVALASYVAVGKSKN